MSHVPASLTWYYLNRITINQPSRSFFPHAIIASIKSATSYTVAFTMWPLGPWALSLPVRVLYLGIPSINASIRASVPHDRTINTKYPLSSGVNLGVSRPRDGERAPGPHSPWRKALAKAPHLGDGWCAIDGRARTFLHCPNSFDHIKHPFMWGRARLYVASFDC